MEFTGGWQRRDGRQFEAESTDGIHFVKRTLFESKSELAFGRPAREGSGSFLFRGKGDLSLFSGRGGAGARFSGGRGRRGSSRGKGERRGGGGGERLRGAKGRGNTRKRFGWAARRGKIRHPDGGVGSAGEEADGASGQGWGSCGPLSAGADAVFRRLISLRSSRSRSEAARARSRLVVRPTTRTVFSSASRTFKRKFVGVLCIFRRSMFL